MQTLRVQDRPPVDMNALRATYQALMTRIDTAEATPPSPLPTAPTMTAPEPELRVPRGPRTPTFGFNLTPPPSGGDALSLEPRITAAQQASPSKMGIGPLNIGSAPTVQEINSAAAVDTLTQYRAPVSALDQADAVNHYAARAAEEFTRVMPDEDQPNLPPDRATPAPRPRAPEPTRGGGEGGDEAPPAAPSAPAQPRRETTAAPTPEPTAAPATEPEAPPPTKRSKSPARRRH